jgi:hypothetical protein
MANIGILRQAPQVMVQGHVAVRDGGSQERHAEGEQIRVNGKSGIEWLSWSAWHIPR